MSKSPEKTEISRGMKEGELMFSIKTSDFVFPSADFHYVRAGGWQSLSAASFHRHRHKSVWKGTHKTTNALPNVSPSGSKREGFRLIF